VLVFDAQSLLKSLKVFGVKTAGSAALFTVPLAFMASLPTLRVSGTCLASTMILNPFISFAAYYADIQW
jgi:hypothetical protein